MEAVSLAPTAVNQQKFLFELKNGKGRINSLFASSITSISKSFTEIFRKYESRAYGVINYMLYFFAHFSKKWLKNYWHFVTGKTAKSILISCGARLAPFDIKELRDLISYDELELDMLGDEKTALFVIISDTDDTFNFIVSIMYTQLFNQLCDRADDVYNGRLPIHVRCLLDEFANIGQIPKFEKLIATIRSREISASMYFAVKVTA